MRIPRMSTSNGLVIPKDLRRAEDVTRYFWAALMGSSVTKDGDVPGFDRYERSMRPADRELAWKLCRAACGSARSNGFSDQAILTRVESFKRDHVPEFPE